MISRRFGVGGQPVGVTPVLDIGGDVGAVVVEVADAPTARELFACPRGEPARHFHTGIHPRTAGGVTVWAALFPEVPAGEYSLLSPDGDEHLPFTVEGGRVTRLNLQP